MAMTMQKVTVKEWQGVKLVPYSAARGSTANVHPWVADFETKTIRAEACYRMALKMKAAGFTPDVIIAHHGWGESMFLKEVWPNARLGLYCEFFYRPHGADVGFDPEFPSKDEGDVCRLKLKNLNNLVHFEIADAGLSPTAFQADTFPDRFRQKITVVHDGIDTQAVRPDPQVVFSREGIPAFTRADEVITFVNRDLEPHRGYHTFMRALPEILQRQPNARILIVGGNEISYGAKPPGGKSWKDIFIEEVRPRIADSDWARVHFLGKIPYPDFLKLLQVSTVHVYLTYPFVLSWSLLEAMSSGCAIVGSDTAPVREVITHDQTGRLVDFFDPKGLANEVCNLLADPVARERLGKAAREFACAGYDLKTVCLPRQMAWVNSLVKA